jgi:chaperonin GroES
MKIRPLHDWAIIKKHEAEEKTKGGILIPESARDIPTRGTVVAIGPGRYKAEMGKRKRFVPTIVKPGQQIYFMEYAALEFEVDNEIITFIREYDILGTFEDKDKPLIKKAGAASAAQKTATRKTAKTEKKTKKKTSKDTKKAKAKKTEKKTVKKTTSKVIKKVQKKGKKKATLKKPVTKKLQTKRRK